MYMYMYIYMYIYIVCPYREGQTVTSNSLLQCTNILHRKPSKVISYKAAFLGYIPNFLYKMAKSQKSVKVLETLGPFSKDSFISLVSSHYNTHLCCVTCIG